MHTSIGVPRLSSATVFGLATGVILVAGLAIHAANLPANLAPAPATIMQASAARPTAHTISSDALPHVAGKNITTMVVEFPPGGFSPPHHHGGSVTVYVLSGAIRSQLAGGPAMVYNEGQTFFEPPGVTHLVAENVSATSPARILAVFVADEGATLTTYHE
jgi:quercetin dioxygenase-like cupin family protein